MKPVAKRGRIECTEPVKRPERSDAGLGDLGMSRQCPQTRGRTRRMAFDEQPLGRVATPAVGVIQQPDEARRIETAWST